MANSFWWLISSGTLKIVKMPWWYSGNAMNFTNQNVKHRLQQWKRIDSVSLSWMIHTFIWLQKSRQLEDENEMCNLAEAAARRSLKFSCAVHNAPATLITFITYTKLEISFCSVNRILFLFRFFFCFCTFERFGFQRNLAQNENCECKTQMS